MWTAFLIAGSTANFLLAAVLFASDAPYSLPLVGGTAALGALVAERWLRP